MDCRSARLLLDFARPGQGELAAEETRALEAHLADCPECGPLALAEARVDDHLGRAVREVPVPVGLRERLLAGLAPAPSPWYERRWTRAAEGLVAAAVLGAAVTLGLVYRHKPITPDLDQLSQTVFLESLNPSAEAVSGYFRVPPPPDFNYAYLSFYGFTELQGIRVPLLVFSLNNREQARVYVLNDRQFELSALPGTGATRGSGCKVEVRKAEDHVAYLVVYTGDSLDPFLKEPESSPT